MVKKNNNIINMDYEKAVELCVEKYFNNVQKSKDDFVAVIKSYIDDYDNYEHYYPLYLQWVLTSECNLRCKHCLYQDSVNNYNSRNDLSHERVIELIDEIDEMGIIKVALTGGEIFLREDIFDILTKFKSKNIALTLFTNATLITDEVITKLKAILNPKVDSLQVSLDGATKETHEKTRGKDTYEKTIQGIKKLIKAGFSVVVACVATNYNISELLELYELARALNVKTLSIGKFRNFGKNQSYLIPNIDNLYESIAKVLECDNKYDKSVFRMSTFSFYDLIGHNIAKKLVPKYVKDIISGKNLTKKNCTCHHHDRISLAANGDLYLCPLAVQYNVGCMGNIKDTSLKELWSTRHDNVLFQKRTTNIMFCQKCEYFAKACHGGCPIGAYIKYGNVHAPDADCYLGEIIMKKMARE